LLKSEIKLKPRLSMPATCPDISVVGGETE